MMVQDSLRIDPLGSEAPHQNLFRFYRLCVPGKSLTRLWVMIKTYAYNKNQRLGTLASTHVLGFWDFPEYDIKKLHKRGDRILKATTTLYLNYWWQLDHFTLVIVFYQKWLAQTPHQDSWSPHLEHHTAKATHHWWVEVEWNPTCFFKNIHSYCTST